MSLTQILIVIFIGLLAIKPNDIPKIIKKLKEIQSYLTNNNDKINNSLKTEQLNFYIQKIISIEGCYDGDYDLVAVKEKYNKLVKSVKDDDLNNIT